MGAMMQNKAVSSIVRFNEQVNQGINSLLYNMRILILLYTDMIYLKTPYVHLMLKEKLRYTEVPFRCGENRKSCDPTNFLIFAAKLHMKMQKICGNPCDFATAESK